MTTTQTASTGSPSNNTEAIAETEKKVPWLAIRLVVGLIVGIVAFNVAKPMIFGRFNSMATAPAAVNGTAPQGAADAAASPLTDPDNLMMEVTRAGLHKMQTGSYAGWQTPAGTTVAFADANSIVVTRITADGMCRVAAIRNSIPVPATADPTGAACTDASVAAGRR